MNKIALVMPYFGKFPNYFQLWIDSAAKNAFIDFFVFTDNDKSQYLQYPNIKWINMDFTEIKDRISNILPYKICLDKPYKLCDFRPLFGLIFESFISQYDFWGHCDADIIWGRLNYFLSEDILNLHDKIYDRGHLCLYRNTKEINRMILKELKESYLSAEMVFRTKYSAHFDESFLLERYVKNMNLKVYREVDCADVDYMFLDFYIVNKCRQRENIEYFEYRNGGVYGKKNNKLVEFAYVHLQKREMNYFFNKDFRLDNIYIYPNIFSLSNDNELENINTKKQKKNYHTKKNRELFIRKINNIKNGALIFRMKHLGEIIRKWN